MTGDRTSVVVNSLGMRFGLVAPGEFLRRNDAPYELPYWQAADPGLGHQRVRISQALHWQLTPVTVAQYLAFLEESGGRSPECRIEYWAGDWQLGPTWSQANGHGEDLPVVGVSYPDALACADWLSRHEGRRYRLPTEAEFEFAARSGCECPSRCGRAEARRSPRHRREGEYPHCPSPVAADPPNASGLHDLNGLLWQWCSDWYAPYDRTEHNVIDPTGPTAKPSFTMWRGQELPGGRVIRGGSFSYPPDYADCRNRHFSYEHDRNVNLGFRLVYTES
jgi:sulfatase modifying factor 1